MAFERLWDLVRANPGRDADGLKAAGYRPLAHGQLRDAEMADIIEWRRGGWYAVPHKDPNLRRKGVRCGP